MNEPINITYENINKIEFHKIKLEVADHAVSLLFGQGYSVNILRNNIKDQKLQDIWDKIATENHFENFIQKAEYNNSLYGQSIITIDKNNGGNIRFNLANPKYFNRLATINMVDNIGAIVWKQITKDNVAFMVKEIWTTKYVRRFLFNRDQNKQIKIDEFNIDIPLELQLKEYEEHNLGIVPVQRILNKQKDFQYTQEAIELSDCYPVENLIATLQILRAQQVKEAILNTTKVFGNWSAATIKRLSQLNINASQTLLNDLFINVQSGDATTNKMVEVSQANPQLVAYDESINNILKHIWRGAGYTYIQSGDTMSGNAETLYANSADIRTTKTKRTERQREYAELIKKALVAVGAITIYDLEDINVVFTIKENIVQSPAQILDTYLRLQQAGIISKARVLQKVEQLTNIEEAEEMVKEAEQEQAENDKRTAELFNNNQEENIDNIKAGEEVQEKETQGVI